MRNDELSRTVSELRHALSQVTTVEDFQFFCGVVADIGDALARSEMASRTVQNAEASLRTSIERLAKITGAK